MTPSIWSLSFTYWLHMLATVVWIGALAALALFVLPAARKALDATAYASLLGAVQRRMDPIAWICLLVLVGTGLFQMSASPSYQGLLEISNLWSAAILVKHLVFFVMTAVSAYLTWGLMPRLQRLALRQARGLDTPESAAIHRQEAALMRLNLILGVVVLALTAVARAS